jgi:predicted glutamine amidotransferase
MDESLFASFSSEKEESFLPATHTEAQRMCGIIGVIATRPAAPLVLETLKRLEYRGYDSAGIATLVNGHIERRRAPGKLANLVAVLEEQPVTGTTGIGHTRWATHGAPTEGNAHPHGTGRVVVVHNGIIENHAELRAELEAAGQVFTSETDTETVAQLVDLYLKQGMAPVEAAGRALGRLEGAYALCVLSADEPETIVVARHQAPLAQPARLLASSLVVGGSSPLVAALDPNCVGIRQLSGPVVGPRISCPCRWRAPARGLPQSDWLRLACRSVPAPLRFMRFPACAWRRCISCTASVLFAGVRSVWS